MPHPNPVPKREGRLGPLLRMVIGSALGILGFGTLSDGFVSLNARVMGLGILEIALGTFVALGVLAPLRPRKASRTP
jgi:hypothetical protein